MKAKVLYFVALAIAGCTSRTTSNETTTNDTIATAVNEQTIEVINSDPKTIGDIPLPEGFERVPIEDTTSFAYFLRNLPLKPLGTPVYTYDGNVAWTTDYSYAIIDGYGPISKNDWQQCADAIIRLRAEWLWRNKRYDEIAFHFTNGDLCEYKRFAEGEMFTINQDNKLVWYKDSKKHGKDYSYKNFLFYTEMVSWYAGTISLEKELKTAPIRDIRVGDIFIKSGSPGHAIIVVDVANYVGDPNSGLHNDKCILVAESYMPAQDIHILVNENMYREDINPWHLMLSVDRSGEYGYDFGTYRFTSGQLKRFK